ncbi:MAG: hypothetical protein QHJ73_16030, partial [Armatimonadota bacterium]|nr:hypothetical protein [Armatimonadota bacterium]
NQILRPGGVIAYNVTGTLNGWGREITRALLRTIATQFTSPYLFEAETSQNTVILAFSGSRFTLSTQGLIARAKEMVAQQKVKLPDFVRRAGRGYPAPTARDGLLLTDDYAPVDRLMRN